MNEEQDLSELQDEQAAVESEAVESTAAEENAASEEAAVEAETVVDPTAELQSQLLRLRADFENFRKRTRKEKEEWSQRCLENVCSDLLTVLDHFDLGLQNSQGSVEDVVKGFSLVREQLGSVLGKYGLQEVNVEEAVFDPNWHEAITQMPSADIDEGKVVAITRTGYRLGERLLRPTQVVVSSGAPPAPEAAASAEESE